MGGGRVWGSLGSHGSWDKGPATGWGGPAATSLWHWHFPPRPGLSPFRGAAASHTCDENEMEGDKVQPGHLGPTWPREAEPSAAGWQAHLPQPPRLRLLGVGEGPGTQGPSHGVVQRAQTQAGHPWVPRGAAGLRTSSAELHPLHSAAGTVGRRGSTPWRRITLRRGEDPAVVAMPTPNSHPAGQGNCARPGGTVARAGLSGYHCILAPPSKLLLQIAPGPLASRMCEALGVAEDPQGSYPAHQALSGSRNHLETPIPAGWRSSGGSGDRKVLVPAVLGTAQRSGTCQEWVCWREAAGKAEPDLW